MQCCGKERGGRFCSVCGKQLKEDAIFELLRHIRSTITGLETGLKSMQHEIRFENIEARDIMLADAIERRELGIARWRRWEAAIVQLAGLPEEKQD